MAAALLLGACATSSTPTVLPLVVVDRGLVATDANVVATRSPADTPGGTRIAARSAFAGGASLDTLFHRARALVEAESGTDLSAIRLELVDDESILAEVSAETRRLVRGQLGDGPLAERLLGTLVRGQIGTYAALYSGRHRAVMVSRNVLAGYIDSLSGATATRDQALLVLMLHELVHAADDLRHDIHANRALDFRASFAQSAVFEGHAQWLTRAICRHEGCLGGLAALDAFMFDDGGIAPDGGGGSAASRPSPLDRNLLEYSYVEGERFVAALAARADGAATLEHLLAEPPHDPLQILAPDSFPDVARETRNRALLAIATNVDHAWTRGAGSRPGARVAVATSPLKGVDLRADPARRAAAIDGFTRLVTAMVAVQFHDPSTRARPPVEVTLMRTDRPDTARLFADTLHAHARLPGARVPRADASDGVDTGAGRLMRTELPTSSGGTWLTVIATDGHFVVQASGRTGPLGPMEDYVLGVLDALVSGEPA